MFGPSDAVFLGLSLALRSHDQFKAFHWSSTPPSLHIVTFRKFHRIGGALYETFSIVRYDAPEELRGDRKRFDSPIRK